MAQQSSVIWDETYMTNSDLSTGGVGPGSSKQFQAVKLVAVAASNLGFGCDIVAAATDRVLGILQNKPGLNHGAEVRIYGYSKAVVDGSGTAIAVGDTLGPNASGVLIKKVTADFNIICEALEACTVANGIITVKLYGQSIPFRALLG